MATRSASRRPAPNRRPLHYEPAARVQDPGRRAYRCASGRDRRMGDALRTRAKPVCVVRVDAARVVAELNRGGGSPLRALVESLRRDVGVVWPHDRACLGISAQLAKVVGIAKWLED